MIHLLVSRTNVWIYHARLALSTGSLGGFEVRNFMKEKERNFECHYSSELVHDFVTGKKWPKVVVLLAGAGSWSSFSYILLKS